MTSSEAADLDLASLDVQLKILFRTAFEPFAIARRSVLEVEALNRLRWLAISTEVYDAGPDRPPVTLLMLAAESACHEAFPAMPSLEQAAGLVARFFARDVPRLGLQRFVTPAQRAVLRAPTAGGEPLAALLLAEVERGQPSAGTRRATPQAPFLDQNVWLSDMDYVMSSEQLETAQVKVSCEDGAAQLCGPAFLFHDHRGAMDETSWAAREAAQAWLQRFVWREREDCGLPQTLVSASAAVHASGAATPKTQAAPTTGQGGRKRLRPGDLLTFGAEGAGPRHLVGRGWHGAEAAHVWSGAQTALLAINLDEEDVGPLDLFLRLSPGPRRDPQVGVSWNGCPVATLRPDLNRVFTLHCHLGSRHRSGRLPNILCLSVEDTFQVEGDGRSLGVALYDLMLAPR